MDMEFKRQRPIRHTTSLGISLGSITGGLFGGSGQKSSSESTSVVNPSFIQPDQLSFLQQLFSGAGGALGDVQGNIGQFNEQIGNQLPGQAAGLSGQLQGLAQNPISQAGQEGQSFLQGRLGQANPFLNQQIDALGSDINRQVGNQLSGLRDASIFGGGLGGSRSRLAGQQAVDVGNEAFARGAGDLRFRDIQQQDQIGSNLFAQGLAQGGLQGNLLNTAFGQQGDLLNLGQQQALSPFTGLAGFQSLLGDPISLSGGAASTSSSFGKGSSDPGFLGGLGDFFGGVGALGKLG